MALASPPLVGEVLLVALDLVRSNLSQEESRTMELEGTINGIRFKPKGKPQEIVCTVTLECRPTELEAGRLSRLAGKDITVTISSRQIELPLREAQPAHVVTDID